LFGEFSWQDGKYIAYSTVWGMFSYDFEEKTFFIPCERFDKDYTSVVIAHELLHFAYFTNFPQFNPHTSNDNGLNMQWWHMSEIFNSVVQRTKKMEGCF